MQGDGLGSAATRAIVAEHLFDLAALTLGDSAKRGLSVGGGETAARLQVMKAAIRRHCGRSDFTIHVLAAQHRMSARHVQRLFEADGQTFSTMLLRERLARAHALLSSAERSRDKVIAIAFDCGFGDVSSFNRAFRRAYGLTPSDVRAHARSLVEPGVAA